MQIKQYWQKLKSFFKKEKINPHSVLWTVRLSNGESFTEGSGNFIYILGDLSPWQRLKKYVEDNQLSIVTLSLTAKDGTTFNLPSEGRNPNFNQFRNAHHPDSFNMFRTVAQEANLGDKEMVQKDWYTVIEAIYDRDRAYHMQLWVDETNNKNVWSVLIEKDMR